MRNDYLSRVWGRPVTEERVDVAIVGGRCAGTAAGAMYARAGRSVLILERARFPADALSSHTMFTAHTEELRRIGAWPAVHALGPPDLRDTEVYFSDGHSPAEVMHEVMPADVFYGVTSVRRYLLDEKLAENARSAGAELREQCEVVDLLWAGGRAAGVVYADASGRTHTVRARLVLGADGQFSTVADLVGAAEPYRYAHATRGAALRYVVDPVTTEPAASTVYHWRTGVSAAFGFPTTPRGQMVVMFIDDRRELELAHREPEVYWQRKLDSQPEMKARLAGVTTMEPLRITDALSSYFRPSSGPGWALVGDSGHFKQPILGQGIRDAIWAGRTCAEFTADHLDDPADLDRALRRWEEAHERECMNPYLAGLFTDHLEPDSEGLKRLGVAFGATGAPVISALDGQRKGLYKIVRPSVLAPAVAHAFRHSHKRGVLARDLARESSKLAVSLWHARRNSFRSRDGLLPEEYPAEGWPRSRA